MGRLLYVVFNDSNPFGSRKPTHRPMMEAARTSETLVDIQLKTRQYISEDSELQIKIMFTKKVRVNQI
jgi:hypothetical protein